MCSASLSLLLISCRVMRIYGQGNHHSFIIRWIAKITCSYNSRMQWIQSVKNAHFASEFEFKRWRCWWKWHLNVFGNTARKPVQESVLLYEGRISEGILMYIHLVNPDFHDTSILRCLTMHLLNAWKKYEMKDTARYWL